MSGEPLFMSRRANVHTGAENTRSTATGHIPLARPVLAPHISEEMREILKLAETQNDLYKLSPLCRTEVEADAMITGATTTCDIQGYVAGTNGKLLYYDLIRSPMGNGSSLATYATENFPSFLNHGHPISPESPPEVGAYIFSFDAESPDGFPIIVKFGYQDRDTVRKLHRIAENIYVSHLERGLRNPALFASEDFYAYCQQMQLQVKRY